MAKIQIDWPDLEMALDSGDGIMLWYLDRETGEVIGLSEWDEIEEEEEIRARIDADEDERYLRIPSLSSHDGFRIMEDFAAAQPDDRVRGELMDALDRHRPFRSFKDALLGLGDVREQWFKYHENCMRQHAVDWLHVENVDAELVPFVESPGEPAGP